MSCMLQTVLFTFFFIFFYSSHFENPEWREIEKGKTNIVCWKQQSGCSFISNICGWSIFTTAEKCPKLVL